MSWLTTNPYIIDSVSPRGDWYELRRTLSEIKAWSLSRMVDVYQFGAVGDGVADDRAAIQAAIDYVSAAGGGIVYFPQGTFRLAATLTPATNVKLLGAGPGVAVLTGVGINAITTTTASVDVEGLEFNGFALAVSIAPTAAVAIPLVRAKYCLFTGQSSQGINWASPPVAGSSITRLEISDCEFASYTTHAINITGSISSGYVKDNFIHDGAEGIRLGYDDATTAATRTDLLISGNVIKDITAVAGSDIRGIIVYGTRVIVTNNFIRNITGDAAQEVAAVYAKALYYLVENNVVDTTATGATIRGISLKGVSRGEVGVPGYANICAGNVIANSGGSGIRTENEIHLIANNIIYEPVGGAIEFAGGGGAGAHDGTIQVIGNTLLKTANTSNGINCGAETNAEGYVYSNNYVDGFAIAIRINETASPSEILVRDNYIKNATNGIEINPGVAGTLGDIMLVGNRVVDCTNGIYTTQTGTINKLTILDNIVEDNGTDYNIFANAPTVVKGQVDYQATWDAPSIADGASASTTFAATGVSFGDRLTVAASADIGAGMLLLAQVSAANTIRLTLVNHSGAPVDLGALTYTVTARMGMI